MISLGSDSQHNKLQLKENIGIFSEKRAQIFSFLLASEACSRVAQSVQVF